MYEANAVYESNPTINSVDLENPPVAVGGDVITVKITFSDGSIMTLKSIMQLGEEWTGANKMADLLHSNMLTFDVDGHTMIFPISSIRLIEIHPAIKTPNLLINSSFTLSR